MLDDGYLFAFPLNVFATISKYVLISNNKNRAENIRAHRFGLACEHYFFGSWLCVKVRNQIRS